MSIQSRAGIRRSLWSNEDLPFIIIIIIALSATALLSAASAAAKDVPSTPSISDKTAGMQAIDGYFPMYWDESAGTLWLEISRFDQEELYLSGLSAGLGSNDIGLDRGQTRSRLVVFERVGPKIFMVQRNYQFRADSDNADERRTVEDAFATSILWGFTVAAETDGRVLVDTTDFLLRDTHGVVPRLRQDGQYRVDPSRSAVYLERTKGFPQNTEIEVTVTFTSELQARGFGDRNERRHGVADVTPAADAVTLRQHHSLVQLPGPGYEPRGYDPRSGFGSVSWQDYATPLGDSMTNRRIRRHRLEKRDPTSAVSEAVEPIVYYLDRGTPEPVRSALLDGARWWNQAFEAAGYRDAFRVELLPEGADNFDVRYNVINWVHRSTRGWSSGGSITDPRTGEIIKGVVTLGSAPRPAGLPDRRRAAVSVCGGRRDAVGTVGDGTRPDPPARCPRGRPHARAGPQLLRQLARARVRSRLPAPAHHARRRRRDRPLGRLRRRDRRMGQGGHHLRVSGLSAGHRRANLPAADPRRRVGSGSYLSN